MKKRFVILSMLLILKIIHSDVQFDHQYSLPNLYPDVTKSFQIFDTDNDGEEEIVILYDQDYYNGRMVSYNSNGDEIINQILPKLTFFYFEFIGFKFIRNNTFTSLIVVSKCYIQGEIDFYIAQYDPVDFSIVSMTICPTNSTSLDAVNLNYDITDYQDHFILWIGANGGRLHKKRITVSGFESIEVFNVNTDNIFFDKALDKIIASNYYKFWSDDGWGPGGYLYEEDSLRYCLKSYSVDSCSIVDSLDSEEGFFHSDSYGSTYYIDYPKNIECLVKNDTQNSLLNKIVYYNLLNNFNDENYGIYKCFNFDYSQILWEEYVNDVPPEPDVVDIILSTCYSTDQNDFVLAFKSNNSLHMINRANGEITTFENCQINPIWNFKLETGELVLMEEVTVSFDFYTIDESFLGDVNNLPSTLNKLYQNYPNPFNPSTTISFSLTTEITSLHQGYAGQAENTELTIYNSKVQKVRTFTFPNHSSQKATNWQAGLGTSGGSVVWDGTDQTGKPVSSGVYLYKLKAGDFEESKKMLLLK